MGKFSTSGTAVRMRKCVNLQLWPNLLMHTIDNTAVHMS